MVYLRFRCLGGFFCSLLGDESSCREDLEIMYFRTVVFFCALALGVCEFVFEYFLKVHLLCPKVVLADVLHVFISGVGLEVSLDFASHEVVFLSGSVKGDIFIF